MVHQSLDGTSMEGCLFCAVAQGSAPASVVCENELAMAAIDLRQFHPGHTIVIPRAFQIKA